MNAKNILDLVGSDVVVHGQDPDLAAETEKNTLLKEVDQEDTNTFKEFPKHSTKKYCT